MSVVFMAIVSKSKITCLETCPRLFQWQYIDKRIPDITDNTQALVGTQIHDLFNKFFDVIKLDEIPENNPYEYFKNLMDVPIYFKSVYNAFCRNECKRYLLLEDKSFFIPVLREKYLISKDGSMNGIIDRVDYYNNEYLIMEYKPGISSESNLRFQLNFYKNLLDDNDILDKPVKYIGAYGYKSGQMFGPELIKTMSYNLMLKKVDAFKNLNFKNLIYPKKPSYVCTSWCPYKISCPKYDE